VTSPRSTRRAHSSPPTADEVPNAANTLIPAPTNQSASLRTAPHQSWQHESRGRLSPRQPEPAAPDSRRSTACQQPPASRRAPRAPVDARPGRKSGVTRREASGSSASGIGRRWIELLRATQDEIEPGRRHHGPEVVLLGGGRSCFPLRPARLPFALEQALPPDIARGVQQYAEVEHIVELRAAAVGTLEDHQ
jgi:hypothetical protein